MFATYQQIGLTPVLQLITAPPPSASSPAGASLLGQDNALVASLDSTTMLPSEPESTAALPTQPESSAAPSSTPESDAVLPKEPDATDAVLGEPASSTVLASERESNAQSNASEAPAGSLVATTDSLACAEVPDSLRLVGEPLADADEAPQASPSVTAGWSGPSGASPRAGEPVEPLYSTTAALAHDSVLTPTARHATQGATSGWPESSTARCLEDAPVPSGVDASAASREAFLARLAWQCRFEQLTQRARRQDKDRLAEQAVDGLMALAGPVGFD
jgi:hypothetical protein